MIKRIFAETARGRPHRRVINAVTLTVIAASFLLAQGLQYDPPLIEGYEPPFTRSEPRSPFSDPTPALLRDEGKMFSDTAIIDFEKRQLTFLRQDEHGNRVWTYHYGELNDYITDRKASSFYEDWYNKLTEERKAELKAPPPPRLQWELAVHYPPWAQRLLGNDPPRLKIEGRLRLTAAYERTSTKIGRKGDPEVTTIPLDFQTEYDFAIRGSVGRLITVQITHSKQDGFDFSDDPLKNFKVEYKESYPGELEDEIIQEVVAGYMGFDMPGTSLSGYSDRHDGLFGIKMRAKLGPLNLTAVASQAQGEALTRELGGKNDPNAAAAINEKEFLKNRYFFLDPVYRDYHNQVNNITLPDRNAPKPPRITQFQAFRSILCSESFNSSTFRYMVDIDGSEVCFVMLTENSDYTVDVDRGYVRFDYNLREDEMVAIAMVTADGSLNKGTIVPTTAPNNSTQRLSLLKPRDLNGLTDAHPLFGLMWRNVYFLPDVEDSKFDVFYLDPAVGDTIRHNAQSVLLSRVMGLTDDQGRARLSNVEIFNLGRQELVIPPWGPGPNGNEPFANPALGDMADESIYRMGLNTNDMARHYVSKFGIVTGGSGRRSSYDDLGWNILEGTVSVKTNSGTQLIEGEDYELDYQMGIIDLISTRARAAESIIITYQRESDFVLERKIFAGLRGEMRLPFISDNSFMAASLLYQNAATSADDIPSLGNEPFSKLHLSYNASLDFQPEWMTKAINAIPLVNTEAASAAKVDFEVVHSRMNANTSKKGRAYIDNFERAKDAYTLSMRHPNWHNSHYPFKYGGTGPAAIETHMLENMRVPAWQFYWFTPNHYDDANKINRFTVWRIDENNPRYSSSDTYIDVLRMHATPASADHPRDVQRRFENSYASITTSFGRSGLNMENHRYLEMVVNPRGPVGPSGQRLGRRGKLMVQIGTFSHDQVRDGAPPNGSFDIEDSTYQNRPELLSLFDKGLNRLDVEDKFYVIPKADGSGWDTLSQTQNANLLVSPRSADNPSGDLFRRYDRDNLRNFPFANGTWGNNIYDSENIDNDGVPRINFNETYYTYEINLDEENSQYIDETARVMANNGWRLYRIPLKEILNDPAVTRSVTDNPPDWSKVRGLRLVWYDFETGTLTTQNELWIAGMELVGNMWEPVAGMENKIEPTSISNQEDAEYAASVWNLIVRPKSGEQTPLEQALRLRFKNMSAGDSALVRRSMGYSPQNISGYDSVTVMVNNRRYLGGMNFVYRFGSDDSTYYEYSAPIESENRWVTYGFSLQEFSDAKLIGGDVDTVPIDITIENPNGHRLRVVAPRGRRPNFTAITYMAFGVAGGPVDSEGGEIWVNELIATGARNLSGMAARFNLNTQWADFLSLGIGAGYTDGDFRTMTDAMIGSESRSEIFANVNAKLNVDKFMPEQWGVSIPVGGSVSGSLTRPTVKPQSDILLLNDDGNPDGFLDMAGDALNMMFGREVKGDTTRAQRFETFTTTRNVYTSFEKTSESENPLVNFTLDRIKTDVSYNITASHTARGPHEHPDSGLYMRTDTAITYAGNLSYDLSPRNPPGWTSWAPFTDAKWIPKLYRTYSFNILPSTIMFDLAKVHHRTEIRNDPRLNVHNFTTSTFDLGHGMRIDYTPINPLLNLSYSIDFDRDMSDVAVGADWQVVTDSTLPRIFGLNDNEGEKWDEYWILYGERARTQTAGAKLTPQFVNWVTHNVEYTASYTGQTALRENDSTQYLNTGVGTSLRFRNSLMLNDFFKALGKIGSEKRAAIAAELAAAADSAGVAKEPPPVRRGFIRWLAAGAEKISMRSINFEYDVQTDLKQSFLSSTFLADSAGMSGYDLFMYQLGMQRSLNDHLTGRTGNSGLGWMHYRSGFDTDENLYHDFYRFDQSTGSWSSRFSTAFTIPDPFKISFTNVSYGWGREFSAQPDTAFIDTTIVLPEIRGSASTELLSNLSFVKRHLTRLALTSSASYKNVRKETRERTDTTSTFEFQPLVSLDGKWIKWPALTTTYRFGKTYTTTVGGAKDDTTGIVSWLSTEKTDRNSHTVVIGYEFTGAGRLQEIKLAKWVIPVQGKTTVGLGINWETSETRTLKAGDEKEEEKKDSDFNYSPFVNYRFTQNISGQARYTGSHKNMDGRRQHQQRFELAAEVVF